MPNFLLLNTKKSCTKNLIIFPGAASLASSWSSWAVNFPNTKVLIAEYPGRGINIEKKTEGDFLSLCRQYVNSLQSYLQEDCIFLGYSFGGYLAYEVAKQLELSQKIVIKHLFLAGVSDYAHYATKKLEIMCLRDNSLLREFLKENVVKSNSKKDMEEILDIFVPILRRDIKMLTSYQFRAYKIQSPLNVYNGSHDVLCHHQQASLRWQDHSQKTSYFTYNSNHRLTVEGQDLIKDHISLIWSLM